MGSQAVQVRVYCGIIALMNFTKVLMLRTRPFCGELYSSQSLLLVLPIAIVCSQVRSVGYAFVLPAGDTALQDIALVLRVMPCSTLCGLRFPYGSVAETIFVEQPFVSLFLNSGTFS